MRGLYLSEQGTEAKSGSDMRHEEWLEWCTQVAESAKQLEKLAEKAWYKTGPAQTSYLTMMLGPFAALEELRQRVCGRSS